MLFTHSVMVLLSVLLGVHLRICATASLFVDNCAVILRGRACFVKLTVAGSAPVLVLDYSAVSALDGIVRAG